MNLPNCGNWKMRLAAIGTLLALAGCATNPISSEQASVVPPDRVISFQSEPSEPFGTVVLTRDTGPTGSMCSVGISIDGKRAVAMRGGETTTLFIPAGPRIIGTTYDEAICQAGGVKAREFNFVEGQIKRLRVSIDSGGALDVSPSLN